VTFNAISLVMLQEPGGMRGIALLIQLVALGMIFWFLLIRPQRKVAQRHQQMVAALKRGDEVMTEGGILGQVVHLTEDRVTVKTGENTRVVVARSKIARVFTPNADTKS
jgi:preprotein translocase subunit YajC